MKITLFGHEITDATISKVSLVKRGAIRAPFKLVKTAYTPPDYARDPRVDPKGVASVDVIARPQPDNGEAATGRRVDDRYPLGRPDQVMGVRKDHSFDGMIRDAARRKHGNGW